MQFINRNLCAKFPLIRYKRLSTPHKTIGLISDNFHFLTECSEGNQSVLYFENTKMYASERTFYNVPFLYNHWNCYPRQKHKKFTEKYIFLNILDRYLIEKGEFGSLRVGTEYLCLPKIVSY